MQDLKNERRGMLETRRKRASASRPYRNFRGGDAEKKKADRFINTLLFQSGVCMILILAAIGIKSSSGEAALGVRSAVSSLIARTSGEKEVSEFFSEAALVYNDWKEKAVAVFGWNKEKNEDEDLEKDLSEEEEESPFSFDAERFEGISPPQSPAQPEQTKFFEEPIALTRTALFAGSTKEPAIISGFFDLGEGEQEYDDFDSGELRREFTREVDFRILNLGMEFIKPIEGRLTSGFGERIHPITGKLSFHYGIDLGEEYGAPIRAAQGGKVKEIGKSATYGNYVILEHENNTETFYGHCQKVTAKTGKNVKQGDKIATVGSTGLSTGSHLHFEIRHDGKVLNPEGYFSFVTAN